MNDFDTLVLVEGSDFMIEVERSPDVRDPAVTLSAKAMDTLRDSMTAWVASRMVRSMNRGVQPQKVAVHVHVALDGEAAQ